MYQFSDTRISFLIQRQNDPAYINLYKTARGTLGTLYRAVEKSCLAHFLQGPRGMVVACIESLKNLRRQVTRYVTSDALRHHNRFIIEHRIRIFCVPSEI